MSISLEEALSQVELENGKTYHCNVKGRRVVVAVVDELPISRRPFEVDESELMMEAWTSLPMPQTSGIPLTVQWGKMPPPSVPNIPREDE